MTRVCWPGGGVSGQNSDGVRCLARAGKRAARRRARRTTHCADGAPTPGARLAVPVAGCVPACTQHVLRARLGGRMGATLPPVCDTHPRQNGGLRACVCGGRAGPAGRKAPSEGAERGLAQAVSRRGGGTVPGEAPLPSRGVGGITGRRRRPWMAAVLACCPARARLWFSFGVQRGGSCAPTRTREVRGAKTTNEMAARFGRNN